jgi:hypothetical protein
MSQLSNADETIEDVVIARLEEDVLVKVWKKSIEKLSVDLAAVEEDTSLDFGEALSKQYDLAEKIEELKQKVQDRKVKHIADVMKEQELYAPLESLTANAGVSGDKENVNPQGKTGEKKLKNVSGLPRLQKRQATPLEVLRFEEEFRYKMLNVNPGEDLETLSD